MFGNLISRELRRRLERDAARLETPPAPGTVITEDDLAELPGSVRRYLRFMGVIGRPAVTSFRAHPQGRFRLRPGQSFVPAEMWQYNTVCPIARLFWMRIDLAGGALPMVGRDSYLEGHGRMLGKLLDIVVVADGQGEPFDVGELTTWLNDAVLLAPSMLLAARATFVELDDRSFVVSLSDAGRTVTARVLLDERGAVVDFETDDRYADLPGGPVRTRWSTPITGWRMVEGRQLPTGGSAVWYLPEGDFTYAVLDFTPDAIEANPALPAARRSHPRGRILDAWFGAAAIFLTLLGSPLLRGRYNRWGATAEECRGVMPGDYLVPDARLLSTRALTINAPPDAVWPWLVQIGQGRGGLYSYDELENLAGLDIHSADGILPDHQHLEPGDIVRLGKPGAPCFRVASADTGRSLVLISADPPTEEPVPTPVDGGPGAPWTGSLRAAGGGSQTRLVCRQRNTHPDGHRLLWRLVEPIGFVMERRMLLGIKERAEQSSVPGDPQRSRSRILR